MDRALSSRPCSSETTEDSFYKYNGFFLFVFSLFWRDLSSSLDPFDLGHYWSQPPKRSKAKRRGLLLKGIFFIFFTFFQIARQIYRRHRPDKTVVVMFRQGVSLSLAVAPVRDAMRRKRRRFFADGNDLKSRGNRWFYRRKKVAFVCAAGEIVTNEGVVTRRATLGKRLTFLDVVSASKDEEGQRLYYLKVQKPNVTKRIRVGATVRFRGIEYKHDTTGKRGERTKGTYIETKDVPELLEMAPASMIVNARKFLVDNSSSSRGALISPSICRTFLRGANCNDPFCTKRHYADDALLEAMQQSRMKAASRGKSYAAQTAYVEGEQEAHAKNKKNKAEAERLFATFLCETFPEAETFVDIAGGSGTLSYELNVEKWKKVILWEPRCVALTKIQAKIKNARRRALQSVDKRNSSSGSNSSSNVKNGGDSDSDSKNRDDNDNISSVQKWLRLENWMLVSKEEEEERLKEHEKRILAYTNLGDGEVDTPDYRSYYETKYDRNQELETFPKKVVKIPPILLETIKMAGGDAKEEDYVRSTFEHVREEFWGVNERTRQKLESSDVLVGLHSDQATESIVDAALELNKSFAVVPCCVFPSMFPERLTQEGRTVTTQKEFVDYLLRKDKDINVKFLPFKGRNAVVYKKVARTSLH